MQTLCPFFELQSHEIGEEEHIFEDYLRERDKNLLLSLLLRLQWNGRKYKCYFGFSVCSLSIVKCTVGSPTCLEFQSSKEKAERGPQRLENTYTVESFGDFHTQIVQSELNKSDKG